MDIPDWLADYGVSDARKEMPNYNTIYLYPQVTKLLHPAGTLKERWHRLPLEIQQAIVQASLLTGIQIEPTLRVDVTPQVSVGQRGDIRVELRIEDEVQHGHP